jgi:hypothetical protein
VPGDRLPLKSGLYAANVVLGKQRGEAAEQRVQQLFRTQEVGPLNMAGYFLFL